MRYKCRLSFGVVAAALSCLATSQTEVTIYNQGFGLVKEVRTMMLKSGRQKIAVEDVAEQIETNSVGIRSITDPGGFEVLEQNYQYDLISPLAILNKAVGKTIKFHRVLPNGTREVIEGVLISSPTAVVGGSEGGQTTWNGMVIRTLDGRILLNPSGEIEVSSIPEGLISKPTLLWDLIAQRAGEQKVELSYLSRGMSWNADYVLTLDGKGQADMKGWVTLVNASGATFKNATLKLLAGDVQRTSPGRRGPEMPRGGAGGIAMDKGFQEESLFEYHLYTLQRPTDLNNREQKQVSLLEAVGVKVEKRLIIDSMIAYGTYYPSEGEVGTGNIKPQVRIEFLNKAENKLGMPLPKGNIKVYQRDASGSVQMLGEDAIDHTPRDEKISLVVGTSFDVVANRKRLSYRRISDRSFEEVFEIEVRNRKATAETVHLLERHYGDWSITKTSDPWKKLDASTQQFVLDLKPNEEKKVTYTIVTRW